MSTITSTVENQKEWRAHTGYCESIFYPGTMRFAVGFVLRLPHNLMEPMLRELSPMRIV